MTTPHRPAIRRQPLRPRQLPALLATLLVALAAAPTTSRAAALHEATPSALVPPPGHREVATVAARGVQIYECRQGTTGSGAAWAFVAPEAELFDQAGRRIGTHGAGPHWQSLDGSRIVGKLLASSTAPVPDAIAWLLLGTQSTGSAGAFSGVTHVQRLNTQGGTAPAAACNPQRMGETARVAYAADYRLFTPQ
ncbi:MAG TPA: DUF3455 domain-containing protein [Rubrivivax sp.]